MDRLRREVAQEELEDVAPSIEPEEHHAYAVEAGAPDETIGERDDSSSAVPADPDVPGNVENDAGNRIISPLSEASDLVEDVPVQAVEGLDQIIDDPDQSVVEPEELGGEEPQEERLRSHLSRAAAPLNSPAEPGRSEQVQDEIGQELYADEPIFDPEEKFRT